LILEPEFQAAQILPENGFGLGFGIVINQVTDTASTTLLADASKKLGDAATSPSDLGEIIGGDSAAHIKA
jgi:putative spermidine/putrescine transport system substrate-binding protein